MYFVQMSGAPGAGKSTLAREIAKNIDVIILDHDIVKTALIESNIDANITGKTSYHVVLSLVDYYLSQNRSVIVDSPCFYNELLEKGISIARKNGAKYKYIECRIDDLNEIDFRLKKRKRMISQVPQVVSDKTNEKIFENWINNMKRPSDMSYLVVDTSQPLKSYLNEVIEYIEDE